MSSLMIFILVILILIIFVKLSKLIFKTESYLGIFILTKTRRYIKYLDKLAKPKKFIDKVTNFGIVLGFGAFGFDYLIKNKIKSRFKRFLIFIVSTIIISIIAYVLAGALLFNNAMISETFAYIIIISTGIMGLSGFTLGSLIFSAYDIISKLFIGQSACPGVGLVIPGVKMPKMDFFIPWYGWLILIFSAIIHEFSHGALLKRFKLKVKSMGFILAGILPLGAFVEPDEKEMKKAKDKKIIKMYTAGPTSNAIVAAIFAIILLLISGPITSYSNQIVAKDSNGVFISDVSENIDICGSIYESPAYGKLKKDDIILAVNSKEINSRTDLLDSVDENKENVFLVKNKEDNEIREETISLNEVNRIGITLSTNDNPNYDPPKKYYFLNTLLNVILWIVILNLLISTVNFLPTLPFDGGGISQIIFSGYLNKKDSLEKRKKKIARFFGIIIIILIILNILPYFF